MADTTPPRQTGHRIPVQTIGRLSLYRRLLLDLSAGGMQQIYSHQLASAAVATPAQVRRDAGHLVGRRYADQHEQAQIGQNPVLGEEAQAGQGGGRDAIRRGAVLVGDGATAHDGI